MSFQYDLFEDNQDEVHILKKELELLKESHHKLRKSQFARLAEIGKEFLKIYQEIEKLNAQLK